MKIYKLIYILLIIFQIPLNALAGDYGTSSPSSIVGDGVKKLNALIEKNSKNNKEGNTHLNQYIFSLTNEESDYIRGFGITDTNKFIDKSSGFVKSINQELIKFYQTDSIALYICLDGSNIEVLHTAKKWNQSIVKADESIFYAALKSLREKIEDNSKKIFERSEAGSSSALITISLVDLVQMLHVINEDKTVTSNKSDDKIKSFYFIHGIHGSGFSKSLKAQIKSKLPSKEISSAFFNDSNTTFKRVVDTFKETLLINSLGDLDINALCENGKLFFNDYLTNTKSKTEKESLFKVASLICEKGEDYYNALLSQIDKLNTDKSNSFVWDSEPILFQKALDYYWERPDAWERYANALITINSAFEKNSNLEKANSSDLFFLMEYCSIEMLEQLSAEEKVKILQLILYQELSVSEGNIIGLFFDGTPDEEGLIIKLIASVNPNQAEKFLTLIQQYTVGDKNVYTSLMAKVDDAGGSAHFTAINQMLFAKLIESEGGIDLYIEKYKDLEVSFLWHQKQTFSIFAQAYLLYNEHLDDNGKIEISADFDIDLNTEWKDWLNEQTLNLGSSEKLIDCEASDCSNVWAIVEENHGSYLFKNFIKSVSLNPYDVVLIEFTTGIDDLGIEEGTFMPLPAFFFYAILENNDWDILKRDVENTTTVGTTLFAGGALIQGAKGIAKVVAIGTLFFNAADEIVLTSDVTTWLENNKTRKKFLIGYKLLKVTNSFLGLKGIASTENATNFMALYFDLDGQYYDYIGKPFEEKFPEEYGLLLAELNKLK